MAEEIQKHQLLVKLLKMTTSAVDAEALVAVRKANALLAEAGWDWDRLMAGKITVVGDPFAGLGDPRPKVQAKPADDWQFDNGQRVQPTPPPAAPSWKSMSLPVNAQRLNQFEGHCYVCGRLVAVGGGFIFKARDYHSRAPQNGWQVICATDNGNRYAVIGPQAAKRQGPGARKMTADDLM